MPAQVAELYELQRFYDQGLYGQGETIAFVEFCLPNARDDAAFWSRFSVRPELNTPATARVLPGGRSQGAALDETDLDLQYAGGLAPGARLATYVVDGGAPLEEFLPAMGAALKAAAADGARIVSVSLGAGELELGDLGPLTDAKTGQVWPNAMSFMADLDAWLESSGLLCFVAAGDSGNYAAFPYSALVQASWPATQTQVVAVGGTQLVTPGDLGSGEEAWGGQTLDPSAAGYNAANTLPRGSGGGGPSAFLVPAPWQRQQGQQQRLTPDVAAFAGPLWIVDRGRKTTIWGTSASAPIMAAVAALYHQATGRHLDQRTLYGAAVDVVAGNNDNSSLLEAGLFSFSTAGPGLDGCTGMGVVRASRLPGVG